MNISEKLEPIEHKFDCFELRSIDAWGEPSGVWTWNDSFNLDTVGFSNDIPLTSRRILKALRDWHYLTQQSKGMLTVYYDGDIYEVQNRKTGEPLFAFGFIHK